MKNLKKIICALTILLLLSVSLTPSNAQATSSAEEEMVQSPASSDVAMADGFREDGKIYVVVGVMLIILGGMAFYMFSIDRKISKLEKELE